MVYLSRLAKKLPAFLRHCHNKLARHLEEQSHFEKNSKSWKDIQEGPIAREKTNFKVFRTVADVLSRLTREADNERLSLRQTLEMKRRDEEVAATQATVAVRREELTHRLERLGVWIHPCASGFGHIRPYQIAD